METQTLSKTALACKLLTFNALCIAIFLLWVPITLPFYLFAALIKCFRDIIEPVIRENRNIVEANRMVQNFENTKNHAHVMAPIKREDVRNN